jgi:hypothetical protein
VYIQQISVNPTPMGLDRCQIIIYSRLSYRYLYNAMFLFVTDPILGLYTTNQRSTPFGYLLNLLVKVHRHPLSVSGVIIAEEVAGVDRQGVTRYHDNSGTFVHVLHIICFSTASTSKWQHMGCVCVCVCVCVADLNSL